MVTYEHETPLRLLQDNPKLATELYCDLLGQRLPDYTEVHPGSEAITRLDRPEKEDCDGVEVYYQGKEPVFALIFEVQRQPDDDKYFVWPDYLISIRTRLRCPVALVVICPNKRAADWAQRPIETGHLAFTLMPFVIGPDLIPVVVAPDQVRGAEGMVLLSGMTHGDGEHGRDVIAAYYATLRHLPEHQQETYYRIAKRAFSEKALDLLKAEYMSDTKENRPTVFDKLEAEWEAQGLAKGIAKGMAKGRAQGKAEDRAEMLLLILEQRGIEFDESHRERITSCENLEQLHYWATRAFQVDSIDRILG